jgi:flagellar basal body-associated protein FliL
LIEQTAGASPRRKGKKMKKFLLIALVIAAAPVLLVIAPALFQDEFSKAKNGGF